MALRKEIFSADISEVFKLDNTFSSLITNYQSWVSGNKIHIPNIGTYSDTQIAKNTSSWPFTDTLTRTDADNEISMNAYQLKPIVLNNPIEDYEFAYDKRMSVYGDSIKNLVEEVNNNFLLDLIPTTNTGSTVIFGSTGSSRAALHENQTGNRKAITLADIQKAARLFNKQNLPKEGRMLIVPSDLEFDIVNLDGFKYTDDLNRQVMVNGWIGKISGFDVYSRGKVAVATSGGTMKSTQVVTATDCLAVMFLHKQTIGKAIGTIDTFERLNDPYYMADIISANVRAKAFNKYSNELGVSLLYETTV